MSSATARPEFHAFVIIIAVGHVSSIPKLREAVDLADLVDAFHILIYECARDDSNYFFLVAGLDEFGGSNRDLIDLLSHFAYLRNVKICVSSRPWVVFEDTYKQKPSLIMHELNQRDIKRYVMTKFQKKNQGSMSCLTWI